MRIVFMGTPDFAIAPLEALSAAGHDIAAVYCQPPRPAGRGKKLRASPVQQRAEEMGLMVRSPISLRDEEAQAAFAALQADVAVVVAYGLILPEPVLIAPKLGCVNIHASLLPRWRGAAPIHRAIMAGDAQTGLTIMQMEAGLDTGPMLLRRAEPIHADDTTALLHDRLSALGAGMIVEALAEAESWSPQAQPEDGVSYARKVEKSETRIDWTAPAEEVDRHIRGLSPFPGAWTEIDGSRVKVLASALAQGKGIPGEVLDAALTIACGTGAVSLLKVQKAGRGAQDASEFLRGQPVSPGTTL